MKIDTIDHSIMFCLHEDARMSIARISKRVGAPESTVRNRLGKLIDGGVVDLVAVTDPLKLGYQLWTTIEIETEPTKTNDVAARLSAIPEVYFVALKTGSYNIIASAAFRSNDDHLDFITNRLPHIPGVSRTATYNLLKIYKRQMNISPPGGEPLR